MQLVFDTRGHCCDLALHPVSDATAEKIHRLGSGIYKQKYVNWWRKGNTATCGMHVDDELLVRVTADGQPVDFDPALMTRDYVEIRRRMYLSSKANHVCVLGYDNEPCGCVWKWNDVAAYDPARLSFMVQRWDRIMGEPGYYILDNVLYDGHFADEHQWCDSQGFDLIEPIVIDLSEVRREVAAGR